MRIPVSGLHATALCCALVAAPVVLSVPVAGADNVPTHHIRYTVSADTPVSADIYYRQVDPPDWATYSHDPYVWTPKAEAQLGPGQPAWVWETQLADPFQWAMVVAQSNLAPTSRLHVVDPGFHCTLEVDGTVVSTNQGPKGALCSIRSW